MQQVVNLMMYMMVESLPSSSCLVSLCSLKRLVVQVTAPQTKAIVGGQASPSINRASLSASPASAQTKLPSKAATTLPLPRPTPNGDAQSAWPGNSEPPKLPGSTDSAQPQAASRPASTIVSRVSSGNTRGGAGLQQREQSASNPHAASITPPSVTHPVVAPAVNGSIEHPPGYKLPATAQAHRNLPASSAASAESSGDQPPGYASQRSLTPIASSSTVDQPHEVRQAHPAPATGQSFTHPPASGGNDHPPGFTYPSTVVSQAQPSHADPVAATTLNRRSAQTSQPEFPSSSRSASSSRQQTVLPIPIIAKASSSSGPRRQAGATATNPAPSAGASRQSAATSSSFDDARPGAAASASGLSALLVGDLPPGFAQAQSKPTPGHGRTHMSTATPAAKDIAGFQRSNTDLPPGFSPAGQTGSQSLDESKSAGYKTPAAQSAHVPEPVQTASTAQTQGLRGQVQGSAALQSAAASMSAPQQAASSSAAGSVSVDPPPGFPAAPSAGHMPSATMNQTSGSRPKQATVTAPTGTHATKYVPAFPTPNRSRAAPQPSNAQSGASSSSSRAAPASDFPPGLPSTDRTQAPKAGNQAARAGPASSSVSSEDALKWAVGQQLVVPTPRPFVSTGVPVPPAAGSLQADPKKGANKDVARPSASKVHTGSAADFRP